MVRRIFLLGVEDNTRGFLLGDLKLGDYGEVLGPDRSGSGFSRQLETTGETTFSTRSQKDHEVCSLSEEVKTMFFRYLWNFALVAVTSPLVQSGSNS